MRPRGLSLCVVLGLIGFGGDSLGAPPSPDPRYQLVLQAPPATAVDSVAVSPDGSLVATAAGEGGVRLYDARTGALLRAIGEAGDRGVSFSPDGRTLSAAGFRMDKLVGVFDVQTGKRVRALAGHTEWEAYAAALSPDGKLLASTGTDKQILVWELATGKLRHQIANQTVPVSALAFSPDSSLLASGGGDKLVRLWDMTTGQVRRTLAGNGGWVCTVAFSPDGTTIASGSCDWGFHRGHDWVRPGRGEPETSEWRLWDVATGQLRRVVTEPGRMLSLAFTPDGESLACGINKDLRLYDLSAETPARVVTSHDATITSVAFTPDAVAIITGSHDQTVQCTNLATGQVEWRAPGYFEQVNSVALSQDASRLVTGSSDHRFARRRLKAGAPEIGPGAVRLWDATTGRMLRRLGNLAEQIMAVALSPGGDRVAAGGGSCDAKGIVRVWDAGTGEEVWGHDDLAAEVLAVAFAPDGATLAAASADGLVTVCDARSGSVARTLPDHSGGATSVAFSQDGTLLVCGQGHGGARVWDTRTGRLLQTCRAEGLRALFFTTDRLINSIGLSRDGTALATCNASIGNEFTEPVRIWDPRTGALIRDFTPENIHGRPMALAPDGSILATGGKVVQLWDVRTGKPLRKLSGHLKRTQSITFSADGRLLVSGGSYGTTNLWEVSTGRHLVTLFAFSEGRDGSADDDWLACTREGLYDSSPGGERYLAWRVGDELLFPATLRQQLRHPEQIAFALKCPPAGPQVIQHLKVFEEPGRFAGWPANHGAWSWGDELLVGFEVGKFKPNDRGHAIDRTQPAEHVLARSLDGGETWTIEKPAGLRPPPRELVAGVPTPDGGRPLEDCPGGIDFTHPDFAFSARMTNIHAGQSRFYYSLDRGKSWQGPFRIPNFDQPGTAARTDYLVNGPHDLTMFLTAAKSNGREGRVICTRTTDGGKSWTMQSFVCPEPEGDDYAIMPSSVRFADKTILTAVRYRRFIDAFLSEDDGQTWRHFSQPAPQTGGNPPSLRLLPDGRLVLTYGYRLPPYGIRARLSSDQGKTWGEEIILRADGGNTDLGYPRTLQRTDGKLVTIYYFNTNKDTERFLGATIWDPGVASVPAN